MTSLTVDETALCDRFILTQLCRPSGTRLDVKGALRCKHSAGMELGCRAPDLCTEYCSIRAVSDHTSCPHTM